MENYFNFLINLVENHLPEFIAAAAFVRILIGFSENKILRLREYQANPIGFARQEIKRKKIKERKNKIELQWLAKNL